MKQKMKKGTVGCLLLSALGITSACVDNSYDLSKDIDMTVTVGGDLTTPGNSSEEITLNDLFDVDYETSDLDTLENGDFVLRVNGEPTYSTVEVSDVTVASSDSEPNESNLLTFTRSMLVNGETSPLPIEDLNPEWKLRNEEVPSDVVDLEFADDIRNNEVTLNLNIKGNTNGVWLKEGMTFTFPDYLRVTLTDPNTFSCFKLNDDGTVMILKKNIHLLPSGGKWNVSLSRIYFKASEGIDIPSGEGFDPKTRKIVFNISIPVDGDVFLKENDFLAGSNKADFKLVSTVESDEMNLGRVRAKVDPEIDFTVSDVKIENLPDFLNDNDVKADLTNPQVLLRVKNGAEVDVNFQAVLHSYKEGNSLKEVKIGTALSEDNDKTIRLKANSDNLLCISPLNENVPEGYDWVKVEDLPDLIQSIPDLIKVESIEAKVLQNFYTLDLGVKNNVTTDYDMNAPLEFGKEFSIVYKDTINGWSEDIEDFEMKEVEISLSAINRIPLNLTLSATAIDTAGNEMSDVIVTTEGLIAAGDKVNPSTKTLVFNLSKNDGTRIKNLDGLVLRLDGKAFMEENPDQTDNEWNSKTLNANQTLKLDDLKLRIKGGVTLDLN